MNKSIIFRIILALVLVGAVLGLGAFVFNAGLARGLAMKKPAAAGEPLQPPFAFYGNPYSRDYMGFGGLCGVMRHEQRGMAGKGEWANGVPLMFDEWHRQAHEGQPSEGAEE